MQVVEVHWACASPCIDVLIPDETAASCSGVKVKPAAERASATAAACPACPPPANAPAGVAMWRGHVAANVAQVSNVRYARGPRIVHPHVKEVLEWVGTCRR